MRLVAFTHPAMVAHDPGPGHPEAPARLAAARRGLEALGPSVLWREASPASREAVERVHEPSHVDRVEAARGQVVAFDPDTVASAGTVEAAWLAAGAVIDAVDAVVAGPERRAWALVRPPGHHAERDRAMGFCFFSNVAVAAAHALAVHGLQRVLVVDWDVHHGNGTQRLFEDRADVLFFSTHQGEGFYPGTGAAEERGQGAGSGHTVNVPLPAGAGDAEIVAAFEAHLVPAADRFRPELVLVSAGFDAHVDDPLGGLRVTEGGYGRLAGVVRDLADRHAGGRLVLALEGGYHIGAVERCVEAVSRALLAP